MKFRTGYLYHLLTALVFAFAAVYLWLNPGIIGNMSPLYRKILIALLVLWSLFRAWNGWMAYKRKKREENHV
ncbi:MAG: hypothetical protein KG003_05055 [Bacteroidetes bacterium]|nr:hypothetical protein [Bacteroidota bacterium]